MYIKKICYVSGPISNKSHNQVSVNLSKFNVAAKALSEDGFAVINPATLPAGLTELQYMSICQPMVIASTHIYMLDGWKGSLGARAELALAEKLSMKVIYESDKPHLSELAPMQPLINGRFKENKIVSYCLDNKTDMNRIAVQDFTPEDRMQFAQLIGYSLGGYSDLSYVTDESYYLAEASNQIT